MDSLITGFEKLNTKNDWTRHSIQTNCQLCRCAHLRDEDVDYNDSENQEILINYICKNKYVYDFECKIFDPNLLITDICVNDKRRFSKAILQVTRGCDCCEEETHVYYYPSNEDNTYYVRNTL
jgi:hypothetical protein